jgi:TP901 family phage tail tape measure protein
MGNRDLEFIIGVIDEATQPLRDIEQNVSGMGDTVGRTATVMAGAVATAGAALAGVAAKATAEAVQFEQGMAEVFTLLPDATDAAMSQMTDDVLSFSAAAGVVPDEVITPLYNALSAGVPPDNVFDFLETANQAAIGGASDLNTAVDGLTSVVNAYGQEVLSYSQASDVIFATIRGGKTTLDELSAAMFNVVPTAASLGIELETVGAALAAMTAQGVPTSVATTQLRQLFVELSDAGSDAAERFAEISGTSFPDFIASGGTVQEVLQTLEQDAIDNGTAMRDLFGSVEATNAALLLTGEQGGALFTAQLEAQAEAAGATSAAYDTMQDTVARSLETLRANVDVVMIQLGQQFLPVLADFSSWAVTQLPTIQAAIQTAFDVIGTAISAGRQAWVDLQTGFQSGEAVNRVQAFGVGIAKALEVTRNIITAFADTWHTLSNLPAIKAAAALAVDIAPDAWQLVQDVWGWLTSQPVQTAIQGGAKFVADIAADAWQLSQAAWSWLTSQPVQTNIQGGAKFVADVTKDAFALAQGAWGWLTSQPVQTKIQGGAAFVANIAQEAWGIAQDVWGWLTSQPVQTAIQGAAKFAADVAAEVWEVAQEVWEWLTSQPVQTAIQGAVSFAADIATDAFEVAQEAWEWLSGIAGETIAEARAVFSADVPDVGALVAIGGEMVLSVLRGVASKLPGLLASGSQMVAQTLDGISAKLPTIIQSGVNAVVSFIEGLSTPNVSPEGVKLVQQIVGGILSAAGTVATAALSLVATLVKELAAGATRISVATTKMLAGMIAQFLGIPDEAIEGFNSFMDDLETWFINAQGTIISLAETIVQAIIDTFSGLGTHLLDVGRDAAADFMQGLTESLVSDNPRVQNLFDDLFSFGGARQQRAREQAIAAATDTATAYTNALGDSFSGNEATVTEAFATLLSGETVNTGQAELLGSLITTEFVAGLTSEMQAQLATVVQASAEVGAAVEQGAKDALQIRSPSRVFQAIGANVVDTFADTVRDKAAEAGSAAREAAEAAIAGFRDMLTTMQLELDLQLVEPEQLKADLETVAGRLREQITAMQAAGESGSQAYIEVGRQLQAVESQLDSVTRVIQTNAAAEQAALERSREQRQRWADWAQRLQTEVAQNEQLAYESAVRMGQVSLDEQLAHIQTRLDEERMSAAERIRLEEDAFNLQKQISERTLEQQRQVQQSRMDAWRERLQAEAQANEEARQYAEDLYEFQLEQGQISLSQHLDNLRERLAATETGTSEEIALMRQIADTEAEIRDGQLAAQQDLLAQQQAMHAERLSAWQERLQAEVQAREDAAAQAQAIAEAQYEFDRHTGEITLQQHLDNLAQRLQNEELTGQQIIEIQRQIYDGEQQLAQESLARQQAMHAERMSAWQERLQAEVAAREEAAERAAEIAENQYAWELEQGDITLQQHLDNLNEQLAGTEQYSDAWMSIMGEIASTQEKMAADEQARIEATRDANMDMLGTIADGVGSLGPVFEDMGGFASSAFDVVQEGVGGMLTALKSSEDGTLSLADGLGAMAGAAQSSSDIAISAIGGLAQAAMSFATGDIVGGVTAVVTTAISTIGGLFSRARRRAEEYRKAVEASMKALNDAMYTQWENARNNQERVLELQYSSGLISAQEYQQQRLEITERGLQQEYTQQQQALQQQFEANVEAAADEGFVQSLRLQYRRDSFNLRQQLLLDEIDAEREHIEQLAGMESAAGEARIATYEQTAARLLQLNQEAFEARSSGQFELAEQLEAERDQVRTELDALAADLSNGLGNVEQTIRVSQEQIDAATRQLSGDFSSALSSLAAGEDFATVATTLRENFQQYIIDTIINMAVEAALANSVVAENMAQLSVLIDGAIQSGDWSAVTAGVTDIGTQMHTVLADLAGTVGAGLEAVFNQSTDAATEGSQQTQQALDESGQTMSNAATDAFTSASDAINEGAANANAQLDSSTSDLETAIDASAALIESQMGLAEGTMSTSADATYQALMAEIDAGTLTTADALNMSSAELQARIVEQEERIASEFAASEAEMSAAAQGAFTTTEGSVVDGAASVSAALDVSQNDIAASIEQGLSLTNEAWRANGEQLDATINSTLTQAQTSLQSQGQSLLNEANALSGSLQAAASTLGSAVAGLGTAISNANATQAAAEEAAAAAQAAVDAVEETLDINSPSRVFQDIGEFTMSGFGGGIVANADIPVNAMQSVTSALSDAANINLSRDLDMGIRARASISATMPSSQVNLIEAEQASRENWLQRQAAIADRMEAAAAKFDTASNELSAGTVRAAVSNEKAAKEFAGAARQFDWSRIKK